MKKMILISLCLPVLICAKEIKSLNDIVVTAQKTEESTFDVPIALSVFDEISIEDKNLKDLEDLTYFVPNLNVINLGFGPYQPVLRGVDAYRQGISKSVGLYIDGAIRYGGIGYESILEDIERIEVLRGPQGTLYGGNSEAGVINVITKKPTNLTEGKISLDIGEDNKRKAYFSAKTPIIEDKLFIGLSGNYYEKDGYIKHRTTNKPVDNRKNFFTRLHVRTTPLDRLEINLISSLYKSDDGGLTRNSINAKNARVYEGDLEEKIDNTYYSYTLNANYQFDNFNLSSTSVYSQDRMKTISDNDYSAKKIFHSYSDTPTKTLTQELKVDGNYQHLKWLAGIFLGKVQKNFSWTSESIIPSRTGDNRQDVQEKHFGIFTHLNYALTDKLNLIGGIRFDKDRSSMKDYTRNFYGKDNFTNISPKFAVEYKINPNLMTYATIAKGYRMGGFFPYAPVNKNSYDSESLINYELGFKSGSPKNTLQLNADIFYIDLKDKQAQNYINERQSYVSNASSAKIFGFELDTSYLLNRNISLFATLGITQAKFKNYSDFKGDYNNNYIPFAPKYNYSLGAKYRGLGGFYASANLRGYGKMYLDNGNKFSKKAYELVDTKIGYEWDNFDLYFYTNNIFDTNYDTIGYSERFVLVNPQREVGIKIAYRF